MSKEQSIAILKKHGFKLVGKETDDRVFFVSQGEHSAGVPVVDVYLYPHSSGEYLLDIDGCFLCPIVGLEGELVKYLNEFHHGWNNIAS